MKALYLTYDGLLDPLGQSQVLPYLYGLQERLHVEFQIISFEKSERRKGESALREALSRRNIQWHPLAFTRKPPLLSKVYDSWRFYHTARRIAQRAGIQLIHARSYVAGWIAHRLNRQYGLPWIFDMRGFWADERRETGAWRAGHPLYDWLYRTWKERERIMLHSAAHIVVLTEAARAVLHEWGIPPEKVTVIPCVADYDHFRPYPEVREEYRTRLGIPPHAFVLGYVGSIGPLYRLDEMLRFFRVLLEYEPESYMVFFTPAPQSEILSSAYRLGIPVERLKVSFFSRTELPKAVMTMDASLVFYRSGFSRAGTSPTRVAELLAMNVPVIVQKDVGDNQKLAHAIEGLYLCEELSEEAYRKVARILLTERGVKQPGDYRSMSAPYLSLQTGLREYETIYRRFYITPRVDWRKTPKSQCSAI